MSAPYRIRRPEAQLRAVSIGRDEGFRFYLDRLVKMIPADITSLYVVGDALIPLDEPFAMTVWAVLCLGGLILLRAYGTADPETNEPTDWIHVAISSVAFLIWVYSLGGPFEAFNLHVPYAGSLLVLVWTIFLPLFYKGPPVS